MSGMWLTAFASYVRMAKMLHYRILLIEFDNYWFETCKRTLCPSDKKFAKFAELKLDNQLVYNICCLTTLTCFSLY